MRLSSVFPYISAFFMLAAPGFAHSMQVNLPNVNVLADPSLSIAITELARIFSSKNNVSVTTAYASSQAQSDNIVAGLEADVFITARKATLEVLKTQGLVDVYSQKTVTRNRLSMVTYKSNDVRLILIPKLPLFNMLNNIDPDFSFIVGDPSFQTSGFFAMKALRSFEMAGELEPNMLFVRSPIDVQRTIGQPGGYGILYSSMAKNAPSLKILGTFPESAHSPILYYGVAVAGANMNNARKFLDFLQTDEAQDVFVKHGFESMHHHQTQSGQLARLH